MRSELPLSFKLGYTAFVAVLLPVYTLEHGLVNFLWFSNIALLGGLIAAWWENRRLTSMLLVSVGLLELVWMGDFVIALARGGEPVVGLVTYVFDPEHSLFVRLLSLYHIPLPFMLFWMAWRFHYDPQAWKLWIPVGIAILALTFWATNPEDNVNWVYGAYGEEQTLVPAWVWLGAIMAGCAIAWAATHALVLRLFRHWGRI